VPPCRPHQPRRAARQAPASDRGYAEGARSKERTSRGWNGLEYVAPAGEAVAGLALTLLVARVIADDHDPTVAPDDPALVADLLDARLDLHRSGLCLSACGTTRPRGSAGAGGADGVTDNPQTSVRRRDAVSLVPVDDPPSGEVVRRQLDDDPVLGQDADVMLTHLAADVGQHPVAVRQLDPKHRVREGLDDPTLDLDGTVLLRHILRYLTLLLASSGVIAHTSSFTGG